jgi:hypothetical protein
VLTSAWQSCFVIAALLICVGRAFAVPTTAPSDAIVEIQLEDPISPESKSYLDLDTAKTFTRGEASSDLFESRRWVRDNGVDLMCESREPSNGLIAYDLAFREASNVKIDDPPDYATLRETFDKAEAQPFDFLSPGETIPRTYLFRTSDAALGVLEISSVTQKPSGLKLRYRIVHEPPRPPLVRQPRQQQGMIGIGMANRVQMQQQRLQQLRTTYGDQHPLVKQAKRQLTVYEDVAKVAKTEKDPQLVNLKMQKVMMAYSLELVKEKYADDSVQVNLVQKQLAKADRRA